VCSTQITNTAFVLWHTFWHVTCKYFTGDQTYGMVKPTTGQKA